MNQRRDVIAADLLLALQRRPRHGRELAKDIKQPTATVARKLKELEEERIIDHEAQGRNSVYSIKRGLPSIKALVSAENVRFLQLLEKHPFLMPVCEQILAKTDAPLVMLFGSYAKGREKPDSDIDIYVETRKDIDGLRNIFGKLSIKRGTFNTDAALLKEIIKDHVIIRGAERYYEQLFAKAQEKSSD